MCSVKLTSAKRKVRFCANSGKEGIRLIIGFEVISASTRLFVLFLRLSEYDGLRLRLAYLSPTEELDLANSF